MTPSFASTDLLDSLGYGYFELDLSGRLTYSNRIFLNALGYTSEELLGKHFRHYVDRGQVALMFKIFAMIHKTGLVEKKLPMNFVHKDGSVRTAEGSIALIRDDHEIPIGFRGILSDITHQREREKTLIRQKKKVERELEIAREIQSSFLVNDYPQPEGWEIATMIRPARHVSGDFYDVFPISTSNHVALIMADVCDKGVGAAMYMAIFRSLLRAYSDQQYIIRWAGVPGGRQEESQTGIFRRDAILASGAPSLQNAIDLTNNYIATQHGDSNMFATIFFGLLDPTDGTILYINAGHEAPLVISNGCVVSRLDPTGPAVGMFPNMQFKIERLQLNPGDSLVLFTDGVTDALSPDQKQFAEDGLIQAATSPASSAHARLQNILNAIDQHIAQREQFDDVTLLAVHHKA